MSMEETPPTATYAQNVMWWLVSIAVSVVCCAVLFVLFASYLVEMKADLKDSATRINLVEEREDRILSELETMNKRGLASAPVAAPAPAAPASAPVVEPPATPAPSAETPSPQVPAMPAPAEVTTPAPPVAVPAMPATPPASATPAVPAPSTAPATP